MAITGTLLLDTVSGAEIDSDIGSGRIVRTGMIHHVVLPSGSTPTQYAMSDAINLAGMPQKGDAWDSGNYSDWFLKRHIIRAVTAQTYTVMLIYEFRGLRIVQDSTTLVGMTTDYDPIQKKQLIVIYQPPNSGSNVLPSRTKAGEFPWQQPLRHLTIQQTVPYEAQSNVIGAIKTVNNATWQGYAKGFWLVTGLTGESMDNGLTFTYSATFSTWIDRDWSLYKYFVNPDGVKILIPPTVVAALINAAYVQDQTNDNHGITKWGPFATSDFPAIFGLDATAALLPINYRAP